MDFSNKSCDAIPHHVLPPAPSYIGLYQKRTLLLFDGYTVLTLFWNRNSKQELSGTKAYKETSEEEKSVVNATI